MLDFADLVAINKFDKRGAEDALKDVKKYITKNKLIWDGKKVIEKTTKIKPKVNPRIKNANKIEGF